MKAKSECPTCGRKSKGRIPDRIAAELLRRGFVPYDELVELIAPSRPETHPALRERRRNNVVKAVGRARPQLAAAGFHVATVPIAGRRLALQLVRLPRETVDEQTLAELTLGRAGVTSREHAERELRDQAWADARMGAGA